MPIEIRASDVVLEAGRALGQWGGAMMDINNKEFERARVNQENDELIKQAQFDSMVLDGAPQTAFDEQVQPDPEGAGAAAGGAPSSPATTQSKSFADASWGTVEAWHAKLEADREKQIMESCTNPVARRNMLQHARMSAEIEKGKLKQKWMVAAADKWSATTNQIIDQQKNEGWPESTVRPAQVAATPADAAPDPSDPNAPGNAAAPVAGGPLPIESAIDLRMRRIHGRLLEGVNAQFITAEQAQVAEAKVRSEMEYAASVNGAVSAMMQGKDMASAENWIEDNTPFYNADPDAREKVREAVQRRWNQVVKTENGNLDKAWEDIHINANTAQQVEAALERLKTEEWWGDDRGEYKFKWQSRFEAELAQLTRGGKDMSDEDDINMMREYQAIAAAIEYNKPLPANFKSRYANLKNSPNLVAGKKPTLADMTNYIRDNMGADAANNPRLSKSFAKSELNRWYDYKPTAATAALAELREAMVATDKNKTPIPVDIGMARLAVFEAGLKDGTYNADNIGAAVKAFISQNKIAIAVEGAGALNQHLGSGKYKQDTTEQYVAGVKNESYNLWRDMPEAERKQIETAIRSHAVNLQKSLTAQRGAAPTDYTIMDDGSVVFRYADPKDPKNANRGAFYRFAPAANGKTLVLEKEVAKGVWNSDPAVASGNTDTTVQVDQKVLKLQSELETLRKRREETANMDPTVYSGGLAGIKNTLDIMDAQIKSLEKQIPATAAKKENR